MTALTENLRIEFKDAYAFQNNGKLTIGNALFRRITDISQGYPRTISLTFNGRELANSEKRNSDCCFMGLTRPEREWAQYEMLGIKAEIVEENILDSPHILVNMSYRDLWSGASYSRLFYIYPGMPFHAVRCGVTSPILPVLYWNYRKTNSIGNARRNDTASNESRIDSILPAKGIKPRFSMQFFGRTDYTNDSVRKRSIPANGQCTGNILFCDNGENQGFCWLQEAPPSDERRDMEPYDFILRQDELSSCCWGISPAEFQRDTCYESYRNAVIFYDSELERCLNIKEYIRTRFPIQEDKLISIVNPWGCGRFPEYVNPQFLIEEIKAAADCGADCYQIDDSWQKGNSLADILNGRHTGLDFWDISKTRLNGTLKPQVAAAKNAGIQLALWLAPSTNIQFDDWNEFADIILDFYHKYGFHFFKLDGIIMRSYQAEKNLEKLMRKLRLASNGEIFCNLDVTNGQRGGFLLFQEYGNIFLENRYLLWFKGICSYHPEKSLRTLWQLSHYLRTERLQMELPAPEDLDKAFYEPNKLPTDYPLEYWAAITLFASPLIWTAPSKIKPETRAVLRKFMELHHSIKSSLLNGNVYPVGQMPSGKSMCGFYADSGYLLVFREKDCVKSEMRLNGIIPDCNWRDFQLLAGAGKVRFNTHSFTADITNAPGFALFRLVK
ncbi:MAG: hypothetical protein IJS08_01815 [Victivallales bacterium]|nr:hypothetical protein [Victivallales bacterium]